MINEDLSESDDGLGNTYPSEPTGKTLIFSFKYGTGLGNVFNSKDEWLAEKYFHKYRKYDDIDNYEKALKMLEKSQLLNPKPQAYFDMCKNKLLDKIKAKKTEVKYDEELKRLIGEVKPLTMQCIYDKALVDKTIEESSSTGSISGAIKDDVKLIEKLIACQNEAARAVAEDMVMESYITPAARDEAIETLTKEIVKISFGSPSSLRPKP